MRWDGPAPDADTSAAEVRRDLAAVPADAAHDLTVGRADASADRNQVDLAWRPADASERVVDGSGRDAALAIDGRGRDAAGPDAARDRPAEAGAEARLGSLALVAGATGGRGDGDGIGKAARFNSQEGIVADGEGHLYVADLGNHTIRKIVLATAEVTTVAGAPGVSGRVDGIGAQARFCSPSQLTWDGSGNLFVVDQDARAIRKVVLDTGRVETLVAFSNEQRFVDAGATSGPIRYMRGIASDGAGNLFVADYDSATVRKIVVATGEISILAGAPDQRGTDDGTGVGARFHSPYGLALDKKGNLFVADTWNLRKVVVASGEVTTLAKASGNFVGIASDENGTIFVADSRSHSVRRLDAATGELTTLFTQTADPDNDGQDATQASHFMRGLGADGAGNLYVSEDYEHRIRKIEIATGRASLLAGDMQRRGTVDGIGDAARFADVNGLASDGAGNLFVADSAGTIRRIDPVTRAVSTFAGTPDARGTMDGVGKAAAFFWPNGLASDGLGNLFASDGIDAVIRKIALASATVTTVAGSPNERESKDGIGAAARFDVPTGLASDGAGNLFVVDAGSHSIRKIVLATGEVTTFAGKAGRGHDDGVAADATFDSPQDIVGDGAGNLYVADAGNATIRKIVLATGRVSTLAGVARSKGYEDGVGAGARFGLPRGLAYDGAGNLYVADCENHLVRKIALASATVTTVVGNPGRAAVVLGVLPGGLSWPRALAWSPAGELYISSLNEGVVLVARFPDSAR